MIDILAYRGSDALMSWFFTGLTTLGLGLGAIAAVGAGMAAIWSFLGIYLGKWFERESVEAKGSPL